MGSGSRIRRTSPAFTKSGRSLIRQRAAKYQVLKANVVSAAPLWSKDDKELYFLDLLPGNGRVNAVKVTTQNGLAFSNPVSLPIDRFIQLPPPGNSRNYDVSPENGNFVVILESSRDQTGSQAPPRTPRSPRLVRGTQAARTDAVGAAALWFLWLGSHFRADMRGYGLRHK